MHDAISYIRVSSDEQAESGLGLEAQRQRIAAYCAMKGPRLAEAFEDAGISGGKPLASRPAGSILIAAANKSKALVWRGPCHLPGLIATWHSAWHSLFLYRVRS